MKTLSKQRENLFDKLYELENRAKDTWEYYGKEGNYNKEIREMTDNMMSYISAFKVVRFDLTIKGLKRAIEESSGWKRYIEDKIKELGTD